MMKHKAIKIETYRDKYFTHCTYEYRGYTYDVEYANGHNVCCTPAYIQHRDKQAEIDERIEREKNSKPAEPINLDEIWNLMGWN